MNFLKNKKRGFTQHHFKKNDAGFTLIEMIAVISIIAILSGIVYANINEARKKARDAIRIADLKQLQQAFDLFYLENGYVPNDIFYSASEGSLFPANSSTDQKWNSYASSFFAGGLKDPKNNETWSPRSFPGSIPYNKFGYFYRGKTYLDKIPCNNGNTDYELPVIVTALEQYNEKAPNCNSPAPDYDPAHSTNCYDTGCNIGKTWLCVGVGPNKAIRENACLPLPPAPPLPPGSK